MSNIDKIGKVDSINTENKININKDISNRQNIGRIKSFNQLEKNLQLAKSPNGDIDKDMIDISDLSKDLLSIVDDLNEELASSIANKEHILNILDSNSDLSMEIKDYIKELELREDNILNKLDLQLGENIDEDISKILDQVQLIKEEINDLEIRLNDIIIKYNNENKEELKNIAENNTKLLRQLMNKEEDMTLVEKYKMGDLNLDKENLLIESKLLLLDTMKVEISTLEKLMADLPHISEEEFSESMTRLDFKILIKKHLFFLKDTSNSLIRELEKIDIYLNKLLSRTMREKSKIENNDIVKALKDKTEGQTKAYTDFFNYRELEDLKNRELESRQRKLENKEKVAYEGMKEGRKDLVPGLLYIINNLDKNNRKIFFLSLVLILIFIFIKIVF